MMMTNEDTRITFTNYILLGYVTSNWVKGCQLQAVFKYNCFPRTRQTYKHIYFHQTSFSNIFFTE
jgi:hypothetical protein